MYKKILIPLDTTRESEQVFPLIKREISPETEVVLLTVLHPVITQTVGGYVIIGSQREDAERQEALSYLREVANQLVGPETWRYETILDSRSSEGIVRFAQSESVDLIAMFVPDRRGLTSLMKGNTSKRVQRNAPMEVRTYGPKDLENLTPPKAYAQEVLEAEPQVQVHAQLSDDASRTAVLDSPVMTSILLKKVDLFRDLSTDQIDKVASLGERLSIAEGETLGKGGELGQKLFIIIDGEAELTSHSQIGEIVVRVAGPGESFPMAALLGSQTLITSGKAMTNMDVLALSGSDLMELCSKDTHIGFHLYRVAAQLFTNRYSDTLAHLVISAERELRNTESN